MQFGPGTGSQVSRGATGRRSTWYTAGVVAAPTWQSSSNRSSSPDTGSRSPRTFICSPPPRRVIAFDLPSHNGASPGDLAPGRTTIVECAEAVRAVVQAHGPARAIVAHSLGAKAVALAAAWGTPVERLVFLAPMGDFSLYLDVFADRHGFGPRIRTKLHRGLDRRLGIPLFDTDIPTAAARIHDPMPLLVVHDPDDPDSPYTTSERIVGDWPGDARLVTTRGLGRLAHYRILRHRPAISAGVDFIGRAPVSTVP